MIYKVSGKVIRGDGYGKKLGFPTVNLDFKSSHGAVMPPEGVYAGVAEVEGIKYRSGIVIGPFNKVEAHLIGYDQDAYGKFVTLELNKFLREFKEFKSEEELIAQIKKDIAQC